MKLKRSVSITLLTSSIFGASVGCNALTPNSTSSSGTSWSPSTWFKKEYQEPVSVATIWKADTLDEPGQAAKRGFGARIYFYNDRSQAIPVEGDLVVHGYLTTPSSRQQNREQPDQKFTFSTEQLASQYSPSDLGASYSIWVPWDAAGGYREEVTLIATFKSKKGGVVQGSPTKLFLPGSSRQPDADPRVSNDSIQQVSYRKQSLPTYDLGPAPAKPTTRITTIELPSNSKLAQQSEGVSVGGGLSGFSSKQIPPERDDGLGVVSGGVEVGGKLQSINRSSPVALPFQTLPPPPQH